MTLETSTTKRWKTLFDRPEEAINLAEAALLFAQDEYPKLDVEVYLQRLDSLAARVRGKLPTGASPETILTTMNHCLFEDEGFTGNADQYYDPRNSFLNDVLDRKLGIPITISLVYLEVGQRLGLPLEGVSFPGHFLVKLKLDYLQIILDPYLGGIVLSEQDIINRLGQIQGGQPTTPVAHFLASTPKKEFLVRMLRNLKVVYLHKEKFTKALTVMERILLMWPDLPEEHRDRGLLYEHLECTQSALQDYQRYIELVPHAPDAGGIRSRMIQIGKTSPFLQ